MNKYQEIKVIADIVFAEADLSDGFIWKNIESIYHIGKNRLARPKYFKCKTLYEVFTKPQQFSAYPNSPQYLKARDYNFGNDKEFEAWSSSFWCVVRDAFGMNDITNGADHYWNPQLCNPSWAQGQPILAQIGGHNFIRLARE